MYLDKSLARNTQASATSSACPARFIGMPESQSCRAFSFTSPVISVSMKPGAMAFERMLRLPNSNATDFVNPTMPAFEAA